MRLQSGGYALSLRSKEPPIPPSWRAPCAVGSTSLATITRSGDSRRRADEQCLILLPTGSRDADDPPARRGTAGRFASTTRHRAARCQKSSAVPEVSSTYTDLNQTPLTGPGRLPVPARRDIRMTNPLQLRGGPSGRTASRLPNCYSAHARVTLITPRRVFPPNPAVRRVRPARRPRPT